jgi:signal peptide peptidase SppA
MKTPPTITTAPLAGLLAQVPMMRGEIHAAFVRDCLPLLLGETVALAELRAKVNDMEPDDNDPDEGMPWDVEPDDMIEMQGAVAVVNISGKLCTGLSAFEAWCYGLTRSEDISAALSVVALLPARAVVLNINSPGGFSQGMPELAAQISALSAVRVTAAFTNGQMCSAAYWLGSQCSSVYSTVSAQVGCVGTYGVFYDYSKMLAERGVSVDVIKAGDFKGMGVFGTSLTKEQRAFMQADVDRTNARFLSAVKAKRSGVDEADLQGQWFDGEQSVEKKLSDRVVGSLSALTGELNRALAPYGI